MAKPYSGPVSASLADFKQICLLGEGAYSSVYKVMRLADKQIYALKKVKLPSLSDKERANALNEVRLLASIKHSNIVDYNEAFYDDRTRSLCIVTEFADGGDLFQQVVKCQKERSHIREPDAWRFLSGMCSGLRTLHNMKVLHRDLKSANIFLSTPDGESGQIAKLGDFNVSKVAKRGLCMTQTGTPYYASPEVWRDMPYDGKSDMWSLGCVIYEMLALKPPFCAKDMEGLYKKVLRGQYPRIPAHFSHDISEVVGALLQVNPKHRPSVEQLQQMPAMRRHASSNVEQHGLPTLSLLQTIKLPKDACELAERLPRPRYDGGACAAVSGAGSGDAVTQHEDRGGSSEAPSASALSHGAMVAVMPGGVNAHEPMEEMGSALGGYAVGVNPHEPMDSLDAYLAQPLRGHNGIDSGGNAGGGAMVPKATRGCTGSNPAEDHDIIDALRASEPRDSLIDSASRNVSSRVTPSPDGLDVYLQHRQGAQRPVSPIPDGRDGYSQMQQRQGGQRQDLVGRGSPSPLPGPSVHSHAHVSSAAPNVVQSGAHSAHNANGQQQRQQRRPMANYARPQYSVNQPAAMGQATSERKPSDAGLRLPRIYAKAR